MFTRNRCVLFFHSHSYLSHSLGLFLHIAPLIALSDDCYWLYIRLTPYSMIAWAAVLMGCQTWLAETPEQKRKASTPAWLSVAMSCTSDLTSCACTCLCLPLTSTRVLYFHLFYPPSSSNVLYPSTSTILHLQAMFCTPTSTILPLSSMSCTPSSTHVLYFHYHFHYPPPPFHPCLACTYT